MNTNPARPCPARNRRGGRRPGAGAKRGNLNALKHGRYSTQLKDFRKAVADSPAAQKALLRWLSGHTTRKHRAADADKAATLFIGQLRRRLARLEEELDSIKPSGPDHVHTGAKNARLRRIPSNGRNGK